MVKYLEMLRDSEMEFDEIVSNTGKSKSTVSVHLKSLRERRNKMADNDILEEQRKARQNYLELKKMQQGEMSPEPKPSEVAIVPKTFKEKVQNYWFHFKWHTIGVIFLVLAITILTVQCANREKYDFQVIYFAYDACLDVQLDKVEEYIETYAGDINGDGNANVNVINCSFTEGAKGQYKSDMLAKVQTQIVGNREAVMYIVDEDAYEYLQSIIDGGLFENEPFVLTEDFYDFTEDEDFGKLPQGLRIALRRISGTTFEKNEQAQKTYEECENIIEKIKNK